MSQAQEWSTQVSEVGDEDVILRGYPISQVIKSLSFAEAYFLVAMGRLATPGEARLLDALLCSVLDYGLQKPGTVVARTVFSTDPSTTGALAAAILAGGEHTMDPAPTAEFVLRAVRDCAASGLEVDEFAERVVAESLASGQRLPGLGHPVYRDVDPRSRALREVAVEAGLAGRCLYMLEAIHRAFTSRPKYAHFPLNDVGMIAVLLADLGFAPVQMAGVPVASSIPGLTAHLEEEFESRGLLRGVPRQAGQYAGPAPRDLPANGQSLRHD